MTPEHKEKIKEVIIGHYESIFPRYPDNPAIRRNPEIVLEPLPRIYELLVEKQLINQTELPYNYFERIAHMKFKDCHIESMLNSFFE